MKLKPGNLMTHEMRNHSWSRSSQDHMFRILSLREYHAPQLGFFLQTVMDRCGRDTFHRLPSVSYFTVRTVDVWFSLRADEDWWECHGAQHSDLYYQAGSDICHRRQWNNSKKFIKNISQRQMCTGWHSCLNPHPPSPQQSLTSDLPGGGPGVPWFHHTAWFWLVSSIEFS